MSGEVNGVLQLFHRYIERELDFMARLGLWIFLWRSL